MGVRNGSETDLTMLGGANVDTQDPTPMPADFGGRQIALDQVADPKSETKLTDWQVVSEAVLESPVPSLIELSLIHI